MIINTLNKRFDSSSEEVVLAEDRGEVVFCFSLRWGCKCLEPRERLWVMDTLLKEVELRLAHSKLPLHLEHALTSVVKRFEAYRFELQILRMAAKQVECLRLRFFRMSLCHRWRCSFLFVFDNLTTAFVKVHIEEDHLLKEVQLHSRCFFTYLDIWHVVDALEIEINFVTSA